MKESKETSFIKKTMLNLSREEKINWIKKTNLSDRESEILLFRFVQGLSLCEIATQKNMQLDTLQKMQRRIFKKVFIFLN